MSDDTRLTCTDEELDTIHGAEMQMYLDSIGPWTDATKTDGYWRLTDHQREEWTARVSSRKKLEKIAEKTEKPAEIEESEAA